MKLTAASLVRRFWKIVQIAGRHLKDNLIFALHVKMI